MDDFEIIQRLVRAELYRLLPRGSISNHRGVRRWFFHRTDGGTFGLTFHDDRVSIEPVFSESATQWAFPAVEFEFCQPDFFDAVVAHIEELLNG